jgi:hypothetical protein
MISYNTLGYIAKNRIIKVSRSIMDIQIIDLSKFFKIIKITNSSTTKPLDKQLH